MMSTEMRRHDDDEIPPSDEDNDRSSPHIFAVRDVVEMIGFGKYQLILLILANIMLASDAMEIMLLSILGPLMQCKWNLFDWQKALLTTMVFVGQLFSSSLWGMMSDKFGRKPAIYASALWISYFGMLSAFSPTFVFLILLRMLVGAGVGGHHNSMVLITEFVPDKRRALILGAFGSFWTIGTIFEILLAISILPHFGWRWWVFLSSTPCLLFSLTYKLLPESPSYLVCSGRQDEALKILKTAAKVNGVVITRISGLRAGFEERRGEFSDLFQPEYRLTTILVWAIFYVMNFIYYGIVLISSEFLRNGENYCSVTIPDNCGLECNQLDHSNYLTILALCGAEFLALALMLPLIDTIGRKRTLAAFLTIFGVCTVSLSACLGSGFLFAMTFGARLAASGIGKVCFIYAAEVYPASFRSVGVGSASGASRVGALVSPFIAQVLLTYSVHAALAVYSITSFLAIGVVLLLPYETKGRPLVTRSSKDSELQRLT